MGANDLLSKCEEAAAIVGAALTYTNPTAYSHLTGLEDEQMQMPSVFYTAMETGDEIPKFSGNHIVKLRVMINNNPSDGTTLAVHRADAAILIDAFRSSDIGATLSAAVSEFFCYDPPADVRLGNAVLDRRLSSWVELDILCCARSMT